MFGSKEIWGLDVGHSAIKAVKMKRAGKKLILADFEIIDVVSEGPLPPGAEDPSVQQAVARFFEGKKLSDVFLSTGLPGNTAFTRFIGVPSVEKRKLKEFVRYEATQNIPFPIEEVIWRYNIFGGIPGVDENVGLIAVRKDIVRDTLKSFEALGVKPAFIQPAPLALFNFLKYDQDLDEPVLILDVGEEYCELIVASGDDYWPRSLPVSGRDFTKALSDKFKFPKESAEDLKRKMGTSKQAEKIFSTIEPGLRNLVGEIQRSVGFYKSQHSGVDFKEMYVFGGSAKLPGFNRFLERELGIKIKVADSLNKLQVARGIDSALVSNYLRELGVAIGLAIQGLGMAAMDINLMPDEYLEKKKASTKRPYGIASVALISIALLVSWYANSVGLQRTKATYSNMNTSMAINKQEQESLNKLEEEYKKLESKVKLVPKVFENRWVKLRLKKYIETREQSARDAMFADKSKNLMKKDPKTFWFIFKRVLIEEEKVDDSDQVRYVARLEVEVPLKDDLYRNEEPPPSGTVAKYIYDILRPRDIKKALEEAGLPSGKIEIKESNEGFRRADIPAISYDMKIEREEGKKTIQYNRNIRLLSFSTTLIYIPDTSGIEKNIGK